MADIIQEVKNKVLHIDVLLSTSKLLFNPFINNGARILETLYVYFKSSDFINKIYLIKKKNIFLFIKTITDYLFLS